MSNTADNPNARAVYIYGTGGVTISGGEVLATGAGRAVHNQAADAVTISGGKVTATTGTAVYNNSTGTITLSGNPTITGPIYQYNITAVLSLSINPAFNPSAGKVYTLDFATYTNARIVVKNGNLKQNNFTLPTSRQTTWELRSNTLDLLLSVK